MDVLRGVVSEKELKVAIHPIVPVLDETRDIVKRYNAAFRRCVERSSFATWLDFFDQLLDEQQQRVRSTRCPRQKTNGTS